MFSHIAVEVSRRSLYNSSLPPSYITSNVRVRKDLRAKIYMLRAKSGMTLQDTFSVIFKYYFKNNPL